MTTQYNLFETQPKIDHDKPYREHQSQSYHKFHTPIYELEKRLKEIMEDIRK